MTLTPAPELSVALRALALSHPREMAVAFRSDYLAGTVLHPLDSDCTEGDHEPDLLAKAIDGQMETEARAALALRRLGRLVALAAKTQGSEALADALGVDADDLESLLECANWA